MPPPLPEPSPCMSEPGASRPLLAEEQRADVQALEATNRFDGSVLWHPDGPRDWREDPYARIVEQPIGIVELPQARPMGSCESLNGGCARIE